ncbi:hypothetical protein HDV02_006726 [Globomyces sp. JEL0801]|nr:hypothetical protein HDV02_006726 [Globomyces sp. JEL0801]
MSNSCLSIKDTSVCAPYNTGLFIDTLVISKTYDIDINVLKDNATIWEWAIIGATSGKQNSGQILSWADWIQCTGYNGEPVQYFRSYDCYTDIFVLSAGCNNLSPASVPPLCTKACDTYGAAIKSLINNITLCTATQHPQALENRQNAVNAAESCNGVADGNNAFKSQSFCINGIESDQKTCGMED